MSNARDRDASRNQFQRSRRRLRAHAHASSALFEVVRLEARTMFCFDHEGHVTDSLGPAPLSELSVAPSPIVAASSAAESPAASLQAAAGAGYVPLAPTPSPWATGYFAQAGTLDLQFAAAAAPDVSAGDAASLPRDIPINANGLPLLNSRAGGAGLEIFLDFSRNDGTYGTYSIDADRANFSTTEAMNIYTCWREVVGYFSFLDVNVTTVIPPTGGADPNFAWLQITNEFPGGAAYVGWLNKAEPKGHINSGDVTARVSGLIHELGHLLNLNHQGEYDKYGNLTAEYSDGTSYRDGPIIGVDYAQTIHRWFYGHPSTSNSFLQDDVQIMANLVSSVTGGDGFRPDDFGNTLATALTLNPGTQQIDGFTERYGDIDVFKITPTLGGPWTFSATPGTYRSQAEPRLEVLDFSGNVIASRDDADFRNGPTNEQNLTLNLTPGTYYVRVSSGGDYDELGYYKFAATQLPANFASTDVGVPWAGGSVTYDATSGVFTQGGGGTDIWNTSDQFRITYAALSGDGSITARVDAIDNLGFYSKAGVMIRQSLAANSAHAYLGIRPDGAIDSILRSAAGAGAVNLNNSGSGPWVRITRTGNLFTYQRSGDGTNWATLGSTTIAMTGSVLIGLATCAWSPAYEAFATFSNVAVTGNITPPAPTYNALPAPTALVATTAAGANTSINLSWSGSAGATGYRIERSIDGVSFAALNTVGAGVTTYTDTNPWGSMRWFYRVSAADGTSVYSAPSNVASAVNKPNAPVGLPAGYTPTVMAIGTGTLNLGWLDVQGETGYRVERSTDGVNYTFLGNTLANLAAWNATGLAAGTPYTFRITPLTSVGDGVAQPLIISTQTRMAAVANLRFTAKSSSSMSIAWNDSPLETGYRVERSLNGTDWTFMGDTAQNVTTFTDNGVTAGNEYYYRVMPWNTTFDGIMSNAIFAGAPAASLPAGWTNADVGAVAGSGAALNTGGASWKVVSGGYDVYNNADAFNFTYRAVTADTTIVARIDNLEVTDNAAKAGLMFRQDLTAGSKSVAVMMNAGGGFGIDLRGRTVANGGTSFQQLLGGVAAPYWLKLTRSGNNVTALYSADGVNFTNAATINITLSGTFYVGLAVNSFSTTQLNTTTFSNVSVGIAGASPTVATPASATPNPVIGTTTNLSVLGADDGGEANLTYGWSVTSKPAGVADPTFSANNTNTAKNSVATFAAVGNYTFAATITDGSGLSTISSVNVTVQATLTSIAVTPSVLTLAAGTTQQLAATARDQFGAAMAAQPGFTWSLAGGGGGSVSASGLYTAPSTAASAVVRASSGALSGSAGITVVAVGQEVAWYKFNEPAGATTAYDNSGHNRSATLSATGAAFAAGGASGNALTVTGGQASLPNGIISSITGDFTIATWVKLATIDTWSRIFDFGTGTGSYMFLTPAAGGTGRPRFGITATGGGAGEQIVDSTSTTFAPNVWTHVAVRQSGNVATLYINGVAVGVNTGVTLRPSSLGSTTQNYLGKSQYADPQLNGSVDDFRIYARALTPAEITALSSPQRFAYVLNNRLHVDFSGSPLSIGTSGTNVTVTAGATTLSFAAATFADILVTGAAAAADALTISATLPRPVTVVGVGGSVSTNDSIRVAAGASQTFNADLSITTPSLSLTVDGAATFTAPQQLAALTVTGGASLAPGGGNIIDIGTLAITGSSGTLDVADNVMIVRDAQAGTINDAVYDGVQGVVQRASNFAAWDQPGLTTSMPDARDGLTTLGVATGAQFRGLGPGDTDVFAGRTITADNVIVMYTYAGDGNLDGLIDGGDYGIIDNFAQVTAAAGYANGDFNYDGVIDGGDYGVIDNNIQAQGAPFPTAAEWSFDEANEKDLLSSASEIVP